ncbi:hypothetical protein CSAL01_08194 [Colletotrichum salicis]|uniref:Heterokaryon incompatibility domain-containing protein n=1 Tax=Colletotrichum salicis TaxID=1209931 RepID=A0A135UUV8_9PEZI|nr:hypothetical protein CSAL01_08194 [Colletotrichum salicis]
MYLLSTRTKELVEFFVAIPPYATLSHTWDNDEVIFRDMDDLATATRKDGFRKIDDACFLAEEQGLEYIWIDTCCLDWQNSNTVSEVINSHFLYYAASAVCIAYLSDVSMQMESHVVSVDVAENNIGVVDGRTAIVLPDTFKRSRWFTRSWTLPELIAPPQLIFYTRNREFIGTKAELRNHLFEITGVDPCVLDGRARVREIPAAQKMFWAAKRKATRPEDVAYSLLGQVSGPSSVYKINSFIDPTILAWREDWTEKYSTLNKLEDRTRIRELWASSPADFSHCGRMFPAIGTANGGGPSHADFDSDDNSAWVTSSVASFESSTTTLVEESTSMPLRSGLVNAISFLSENRSDRLRRNLTRILRSWGLELAIEAASKEEVLSAVFFRVYRVAIATEVTSRIVVKTLEPIALDQPRTKMLEPYPGTLSEDLYPDEVARLEQEDDNLSREEDDDFPDEKEKEEQTDDLDFESIRASVLSSAAFENMTRRLSDFVNPSFRTQAQKLLAKVLEGKDTVDDQYWIGMKDKMQVILTELEESCPEGFMLDIETMPTRLDNFQTWVETLTKEDWDWWPLPSPKHVLSSTEARLGWRCRCGISKWETVPASFAGDIAMLLRKYPLTSRNHTASASNPTSDALPTSSKADETSSLGTRSIKTLSANESSKLPDPTSSPGQETQTGQKREYPRPRYIFLLATTRRHRLRQLPSLYLDTKDFGQELRKAYRELKGFWRWWLSPYNFSHCDFVRFEKFCRNGFAHRGLEVPNTSQKDYYYNPRPALREPLVFHYTAKSEAVIWASLGLPFYDTVEALSDDTVGCIPQRYHYLDERSNRKEDFWGLSARA